MPITLPTEITYEWTPELIKAGARRFIFRQAGLRVVVVLGIIVILIFFLAFLGSDWWWVLAIAAAIPPALWGVYYYKVTRIQFEMPDRQVKVRVEAGTITFQTSEHTSTLKWSAIKRVWTFPDVVLLFTYSKQNYSALPVAALGEELRRFIELKVKESGGEVR